MGGDELVDLVDLSDTTIGKAKLSECLEKGLLHRAVAVLVLRKGGKLLLQQRSLTDRWHPGRWTLSCTGHVRAGESYLSGARRELSEELGLRSRLIHVVNVTLPKVRSREYVEWEIVSLYAVETDAPAHADPVEIHQVREVGVGDVRKMMKGRNLTPDAKLLLKRFLDSSRGRFSSLQTPQGLRPPSRATR